MSDTQAKLRAACGELVTFALARPRGGDASWDERLRQLGLTPLPAPQRQLHLQHGPPLTKGPVTLELRHGLEVAARAVAPDDEWPSLLIEDALREFLNAAKPVVTTSSIFANAVATTRTYDMAAAGAQTVRCATCGAPRMDGQTDMVCGYCGSPMKVTD